MTPGKISGTCCAALLLLGSHATSHGNDAESPWHIAGQQGLMRFVIVPEAMARDRPAYARQIDRLCEPNRSCFLNFYTNTSGAEVAVPLPDAIDREATAVFRRSPKQGAEMLRFSCRLQLADGDCF
jgi:hypothetical protein